jgi:SAM-dependent methyltransferase
VSTSSFFDDQHTADQLPLPLHFRLLRRWEVQRVDVAARLLPKGGKLLDIGCGDGELIAKVGDGFDAVTASDVSPAALDQARERLGQAPFADRVTWQVIDGSARLPFADASFDKLVSLSTLQYIFDPEAFLREAHRVLTPSGLLLIEVPNMAYFPQRLRLLCGYPIRTSFWAHGIDGGNLHYFTLDSVAALVTNAGFKVLKHSGSGVFASVRTWRVSLLCGNIFLLAQK